MQADELTLADPSDLGDALAFALQFQGRKRVHNADEIMAEIVGVVEHLERAGFVVMKRPADVGAAALNGDSRLNGEFPQRGPPILALP